MKKLDKSKPHGTITGCDQGRMYEQDGVFFNGDGTEWVMPTDGDPDKDGHAPLKPRAKVVAKPVVPAKAIAVKAVKSAADSQVDAQLQH